MCNLVSTEEILPGADYWDSATVEIINQSHSEGLVMENDYSVKCNHFEMIRDL